MPQGNPVKRQLAQKRQDEEFHSAFDYSDPGTLLINAGQRNSRYNDFQPAPRNMEEFLHILNANLMRRRQAHQTRGLGGLFGGERPHTKRD